MNTTIADLAVEGLNVVSARGIVRVRDGQDTWLCRGAAWDAALAELDQQPGDATDDTAGMLAYDALCRAVDGPIASLNGTSRGEYQALVREAYAAQLLDEDDVRRFGVTL